MLVMLEWWLDVNGLVVGRGLYIFVGKWFVFYKFIIEFVRYLDVYFGGGCGGFVFSFFVVLVFLGLCFCFDLDV